MYFEFPFSIEFSIGVIDQFNFFFSYFYPCPSHSMSKVDPSKKPRVVLFYLCYKVSKWMVVVWKKAKIPKKNNQLTKLLPNFLVGCRFGEIRDFILCYWCVYVGGNGVECCTQVRKRLSKNVIFIYFLFHLWCWLGSEIGWKKCVVGKLHSRIKNEKKKEFTVEEKWFNWVPFLLCRIVHVFFLFNSSRERK